MKFLLYRNFSAGQSTFEPVVKKFEEFLAKSDTGIFTAKTVSSIRIKLAAEKPPVPISAFATVQIIDSNKAELTLLDSKVKMFHGTFKNYSCSL